MIRVRLLTLAFVTLFAGLAVSAAKDAAVQPSARELAGLWKAKKRFGPDARGPMIVRRTAEGFVADMGGRVVAVLQDGNELTFALPSGEGSFRGKVEPSGDILGHWFPPPSSAVFTGGVFASPVRLKRDSAGRWSGPVQPYEETFTFYLLLSPRPDGSATALLRNPDRDLGNQMGVERLTRNGDAVALLGKGGGETLEHTLSSGRFDAESQVLTLDFPGRGGSYDFTRDTDDSDFYPRGKHPGRYAYHPPPAGEDGWPVATLEDVGIDRAALERFVQRMLEMPMDAPDAKQLHAVLIARHGKLVFEEYFHGASRDHFHDTRSAAKSVTSVLVGAAMQAGVPIHLDDPVYRIMNDGVFPSGLEPLKRTMTLEHLLSMSSGYFCDDTNQDAPGNESTMLDQNAEPDYYRYTLKVPLATPPGENAVYCSASPHLALGMLAHVTGELPLYSFDRLLGAPMKIVRYAWLLDPAGHPFGGGSAQFLPRDFMKFGQLLLVDGVWNGKRLLSHDFVARTTSRLYHLRHIYYGYLWWGIDYPYKDRTVRAFAALGAGGQTVMVVPELDLVVETYAANYATKGSTDTSQNLVPRYLLPAVREAGDDSHAPVTDRDFTTPYGASTDGSPVVTQ